MKKIPFALLLLALSARPAAALLPTDLMCGIAAKPGWQTVDTSAPVFSWCLKNGQTGDAQTAYQLQAATDTFLLRSGKPDLWDSGKVVTNQSLYIPYGGSALPLDHQVCWRVRVWDAAGSAGDWSYNAAFRTPPALGQTESVYVYPLDLTVCKPVAIKTNASGRVTVEFGQDRFGWLEFAPQTELDTLKTGRYSLKLYEKLPAYSCERADDPLEGALSSSAIFRVPLPDERPPLPRGAALMPAEIGHVRPFAAADLAKDPLAINGESVRQLMITFPFDAHASAFVSDLRDLDAVYAFAKESIRVLSFTGLYIDNGATRTPRPSAARLQQLGHFATDRDFTMSRRTLERLLSRPVSNIIEERLELLSLAWNDWMYSGDSRAVASAYPALQKLAELPTRADGLAVVTNGLTDRVDLRPADADDFAPGAVSSVANAFYYRALRQMASIAETLCKTNDAAAYRDKADKLLAAYQTAFYDVGVGRYVDHEGCRFASLHANLYPLAFGLVPDSERPRIARVLTTYGMRCSPYAAEALVSALFEADLDAEAIRFLTARGKNSWLGMKRSGATLTSPVWQTDDETLPGANASPYGAAPAYLIPRYVLGVSPLEPGYAKALIRPQATDIGGVQGYVPTVRGRVSVGIRQRKGRDYKLLLELPAGMTARVELPALNVEPDEVSLDGRSVRFTYNNGRLVVDPVSSGAHTLAWSKGTSVGGAIERFGGWLIGRGWLW